VALRQEEFASLCDDVDLDRDRALVERCQAGDSAAFGNLYARYYERLLRFCLRRLNDRHEAEDAAQEAFARAWKALPQFAGERRFYPWLTVIAGNICTDMLRRRSRSTPTDDIELGSHLPLGGGGSETSEELVLASVDGEIVTRALGRLSTRHRHVLAMREGSGWTYQQIADHEGVEIGTIETLLWRARQALKREFAVLSESKGALAGFLAGAGALVRRTVFKVAHRSSMVQTSGTGGGLRNALTGVAITSVAVAAALITPHALSTPQHSSVQAAPGSNLAAPGIPILTQKNVTPSSTSSGTSSNPAGGGGGGAVSGAGGAAGNSNAPASSSSGHGGSGSGTKGGLSGLPNSGNLTPVIGGLGQATTNLTNTVNGLVNTVTNVVKNLTKAVTPPSNSNSSPTLLPGLQSLVQKLLK
jgi:RNA polymerase sigma-70 factor, ECF subfamily